MSTAPARSPLSGCLILTIAVCVMLFSVGFMIRVFFRQAEEIEKFTDKQAVTQPIATATPEQANDLQSRIDAFRNALKNDAPAELALTADDINHAIATYEPLKDLRSNFFIQSIADGHITATISYQLNSRPRLAKADEKGYVITDPWFLNATLLTRPILTKGELALIIDQITPTNGVVVPDPFRQQMSPYRITERYLQDPQIAPLMAKLTSAEIRDHQLILRRKNGETPPDIITNEQTDVMSGKFFKLLGFFACAFLVLVGTFLFISIRKKSRAEAP